MNYELESWQLGGFSSAQEQQDEYDAQAVLETKVEGNGLEIFKDWK